MNNFEDECIKCNEGTLSVLHSNYNIHGKNRVPNNSDFSYYYNPKEVFYGYSCHLPEDLIKVNGSNFQSLSELDPNCEYYEED